MEKKMKKVKRPNTDLKGEIDLGKRARPLAPSKIEKKISPNAHLKQIIHPLETPMSGN